MRKGRDSASQQHLQHHCPFVPPPGTPTPTPARALTDGSAGDAARSAAANRWRPWPRSWPPGPQASYDYGEVALPAGCCPSPSSTQRKRALREDAKDSRLATSPSSRATTSAPMVPSRPPPRGRPLLSTRSPGRGHNAGTQAVVTLGRLSGYGRRAWQGCALRRSDNPLDRRRGAIVTPPLNHGQTSILTQPHHFHQGRARDHTGVTTPGPTRTHATTQPSVCPSPPSQKYLYQGNP